MNDRTSFIFNGARQEVLKLLADESTEPYRRGLAPPRKTMLEDEIPLEKLAGDTDMVLLTYGSSAILEAVPVCTFNV